MRFVSDSSLGRKLTWQAVLASALVAVCACTVMMGWETMAFRRASLRLVSTQAEFVSRALAGSLARRDVSAVVESLGALEELDELEAAGLYLPDGSVLASYQRPGTESVIPNRPDQEALYVDRRNVTLFMPVTHDGERVGTLFLLTTVAARPGHALIVLPVLAAVLLAVPLGRLLVHPLSRSLRLALNGFARHVKQAARNGGSARLKPEQEMSELRGAAADVNLLLDGLHARDTRAAELQREMDQRVQARTAQLARKNQELRMELERLDEQREKALEQSDKKSTFLARMSHELRTPMNGILGMTDLLLRTKLDRDQQRLAVTVRSSGTTLLDIINDILDFSKMTAGMLELECVRFDVREVVDDCLQLLAERAHNKGVVLARWVDDAVPTGAIGDPVRLRQILINLVGNAIKFTLAGEVTVEVGMVHEVSGRAVLRFQVADTGCGIKPEAQAQIFDSFSQAENTKTADTAGTGLGLAIARQLVYLMGGEIGLESCLGQGSTFWFTACFEAPRHDIGEHVASRRGLEGLCMLVVGPDDAARAGLCRRLESWGITDPAEATGEATVDAVLVYQPPAPPSSEASNTPPAPSCPIEGVPALLLAPLGGAQPAAPVGREFAGRLPMPLRDEDLYLALSRLVSGTLTPESAEAGTETGSAAPIRYQARILVAEDNPVNQEVARGMLESFGCSVTIAADGSEAVQLVREESFDLVFMDCQMPVMNGYDAARAIHGLDPARATDGRAAQPPPVIALTSEAGRGSGPSQVRAAMDDVLGKPFESEDMADMLYRWLPASCRVEGVAEDEPAPAATDRGAASGRSGPVDDSPLNLEVLEQIRRIQGRQAGDLLRRVISSYLEHTPQLVQALGDALQEGDAGRVRSVAHTLKSSSANVGAQRLAENCRRLEAIGGAQRLDGEATELVERIGDEFEAARDALGRELQRSTP